MATKVVEHDAEAFRIPTDGVISTKNGSTAFRVTGFYSDGSCDATATIQSKDGHILGGAHGWVKAKSLAEFNDDILNLK